MFGENNIYDDIFDLIYGHNSKSMRFIVRSNYQIASFEKNCYFAFKEA